jgi:hypothetical protein
MIHLPNALIIVGTNRNSGKTTLACELIRSASQHHPVTAIKISPHFHKIEKWEKIVQQTTDFVIIEETRTDSGKDSSRMLGAGAAKVYYLQVWDRNLDAAFKALLPLLNTSSPIICESGWLRKVIEPGAFIILNRKGNMDMKESIMENRPQADLWIEFDGNGFDPGLDNIRFENKRWWTR